MLPGCISGHYRQAQCRIDLGALASAARTAFRQERVEAIDAANQCLTLSEGGRLFYDYLSIDTGSEIDGAWSGARRDMVLPIKPLDNFFERWPAVIAAARRTPGFRIVVVGGGAAGVETAMAVSHALGDAAPGASVALVSASAGVLAGHSPSVRRRVAKSLAAAGIVIHAQRASGHAQGVELADGSLLRADCVITATGARAPGFLKRSGLELDPAGYIAVNPHHQSCSHANVFAAGDVCARKDVVMARSGTHAVHAGPVLAHNLFAAVRGEPLPQHARNDGVALSGGAERLHHVAEIRRVKVAEE